MPANRPPLENFDTERTPSEVTAAARGVRIHGDAELDRVVEHAVAVRAIGNDHGHPTHPELRELLLLTPTATTDPFLASTADISETPVAHSG